MSGAIEMALRDAVRDAVREVLREEVVPMLKQRGRAAGPEEAGLPEADEEYVSLGPRGGDRERTPEHHPRLDQAGRARRPSRRAPGPRSASTSCMRAWARTRLPPQELSWTPRRPRDGSSPGPAGRPRRTPRAEGGDTVGTVYQRGSKLWIGYKDVLGKWQYRQGVTTSAAREGGAQSP